MVNTLDPDVLVMGGGMSNVDELYVDLPAALARYTFSPVFETPIRKAVHGDSSGVRGAAWLWKDADPIDRRIGARSMMAPHSMSALPSLRA